MVKLTFANGTPNTSLEIGDKVYTINNGVSSQYNDVEDGGYNCIGVVANITIINGGFIVYVAEQPVGFSGAPLADTFIFFAKNNDAELSSLKGYFLSANIKNNSNKKANLFSLNCNFTQSSK